MYPFMSWTGPNGEVPLPPRFKRGTIILIALAFSLYLGVIVGGVLTLGVFKTIALTLGVGAVLTLVLAAPLLWDTWYRFGLRPEPAEKDNEPPPDG